MTTYKELDYLESTGTQYIDTLWHPQSNNLRVKFKVKSKGTPRSTSICGAENSNIVPRWVFVMFGQAADDTKTFPLIGDWKNGGTGFAAEGFTFTDGTILDIDWTTSSTSTTITDSISNITYTHTFDTAITYSNNTTTLKLFQNGDAQKSSIDMYYYQIYDNNTLVRDFVPVLDFNKTPAMYDKVNDVLYYNQGTGQFLYCAKETEPSIQLRRKFNMLLASHKKPEYTPLKYLESTGTQYIDTGITGDENTKWIIAAEFTSITGAYMGQSFSSAVNTEKNRVAFGIASGQWYCGMGDTNNNNLGTADTQLHIFTVDLPNKKFYIDGTLISVSWTDFAQPTTILGGMCLFGRMLSNSGAISPYASARVYSSKIYKNNVLVQDLIPILDKNGVPCMWDRVTNKLFYNDGTGNFAYKEWDMTPVDYLYCDGNAYTSTYCYGNSNTKMEMVLDIKQTPSGNTGCIGSRGNSANSNLLAVGYGASGSLAVDFNNSSYSTYRASIVFQTNKKYRVYTSKERRTIIDEDTGTVLAENNTLCNNTMSTDVLLLGSETGVVLNHVGKIYSAKVWNGNEIIRDMTPVASDVNVCGMYDSCLNVIFTSLGSSEFEGHIVVGNDDYKLVHYIKSSGTQKIDTGLYFDVTENFETMARVINYDDNRKVIVGDYTDPQHCSVSVEFASGTTDKRKPRAYIQFATSDTENSIYGTQLSLNVIHKVGQKWVPSTSTQTLMYDSVVTSQTRTKTPTLDDPIYTIKLFLDNRDNTSVLQYPLAMYSLWIKQADVLLRDYIPVIRTSDSAIGMFDKVNKTFAGNIGAGSFTTG